jgi:hypothetical protein
LISVLLGIAAHFVEEFPQSPKDPWVTWFWIAGSGFVLCLVVSSLFLVTMMSGYKYADLATPKEIQDYLDRLGDYYKTIDESSVQERLEEELAQFLEADFVTAGQVNTETNESKAWCLHWARRWIIFGLAALIVAAIPFYVMRSRSPDVKKVEIVNLGPKGQGNASTK